MTLSLLNVPAKEKFGRFSFSGRTNPAGRLNLTVPPDVPLPRNPLCQIKANGPGAAPLLIASEKVYTTRTLELALDKAYDFHGTVYWDPKGTGMVPAPGAQISLVGASTGYNLAASNDPSRKVVATATADAQGHYEVRAFPDNPVHIWARLGEFVTAERPVTVMPEHGKRSGPFDVYLEHGLTLTALVSDKATFQPIPNATVEVEFAGEGLSISGTTNGDGFCSLVGLPAGFLHPFAQADNYTLERATVEVSPETDNTVAFYLEKGSRARVRTIDYETKKPVGNVGFSWGAPYRDSGKSVLSDARGFALLEGVPLGVRIYVYPSDGQHALPQIPMTGGRPGQTRELKSFFEAEEGKTVEVTLEVSPKQSEHESHDAQWRDWQTVEGEVVDTDGKPVPGAVITASTNCCLAQTATNATGQFRLENACVAIYPVEETPLPDLETMRKRYYPVQYHEEIYLDKKDLYVPDEGHRAPDGTVQSCYIGPARLRVEAEGYSPVLSVLAGVGKKNRIVLQDKNVGRITGQVLDKETREPISDYRVSYVHLSDFYSTFQRIFSKEGRFTLYGIADGESEVMVTADGYAQQSKEVKVGDPRNLEFLMERTKTLEGVVLDGTTRQVLEGVEVRFIEIGNPSGMISGGFVMEEYPVAASATTNGQGSFSLKQPYQSGCLLFIKTGYKTGIIPLESLDQYRDAESGKIAVELEKPAGSITAKFMVGGRPSAYEDVLILTTEDELWKGAFPRQSEDGTYCWEGIARGRYWLMTYVGNGNNSTKRWKVFFAVSSGENKTLVLGEGDNAVLSGQIFKPGGQVYPQARLVILSSYEKNGETVEEWYLGITDSNGFYRIGNIHPGTFNVRVEDSSTFEELYTLGALPIAGEVRHDITLKVSDK
ncbi:MAG TPA: carboxypeptidase regulatory-like domain-containing protein [Candidatus Sumerlaeota bacterium]|nr:carboxypeptidase regulatory-like domain-containing protein [Candidatus Sumerlaeota bacterium]